MPGNSETQKKKRPMGLKARAASSKKQKSDGVELTEQVVNDFDEENTATIMLKNDLEEDANEMDELEGIFDSAMEELSGGDPERAITLLRGTIHECDRILRVHDRDVEAGVEAIEIEPRFYYIYGTALFSISELSATELEDQRWEYLELSQHRLEQAKEAMTGKEPFAWRVYDSLAKIGLDLLSRKMSDEEAKEEAALKLAAAMSKFDSALDALVNVDAEQAKSETLSIVEMVQSLADSSCLGEAGSATLMDWTEAKLAALPEPTAEDEHAAEIRYLRARALWIRASVLLGQMDETDEMPDKGAFQQLLNEASDLLVEAESRDALLLRGEVQLNLGNVQEDGDEQDRLYRLAIKDFKLVQANGELSEELTQFIEDFEQDDNDEDDVSDANGDNDGVGASDDNSDDEMEEDE
ncbi:hypothetical protein GGH94_002994 [Coemansia aciculifera]|uniref:Enhancer of translation termination 1 n=1 Tax=Coemansia aciculifera TaxID=417176 RepID=A0A9W8IHX4_9FUNG|nr:hypothetical protein GGH94_002994 [Coemansia aciculifera]